MTLYLHRAERTDVLADGLGELLATPLPDPLAEEVVVVPARGVERWLTQRLSHRLGAGERGSDGICAGVRFLSPHSLTALLLGRENDDIWAPDRLVWPLLEVIDGCAGDPVFATLSAHLGYADAGEDGVHRQSRRYSVARRLAGLFASYAAQRPQLVADWREGRDTDGVGGALEPDLVWQAELWRRLVVRVGEPAPDVRQAQTVARLRDGDESLDLPARLSLFGHTRIPATEAELLGALGRLRDVHLWLPQASPQLWDDLAPLVAEGPVPRADDDSAAYAGHPLLAALGRDARELQRTLTLAGEAEDVVSTTVAAQPARPPGVLQWLQADLRSNREPTTDERSERVLADGDRSVQVHACHSASRQVDVLREVLTGLLEDDPTLQPWDIVVMCPDIETYAPLISAGFGLAGVVEEGGHPAHGLRVQLADRALSSTNPLLGVAATLIELAGGRVTASEVLDLAGHEAVRRRFGWDDDDLARIAGWVAESGIRWGLDAERRGRFSMEKFGHNTWRAGLDRILLGVAMSGDELTYLSHALPVDDVGSNDVELVGRLTEYADRLGRCLRALDDATGVAEWMSALDEGVAGLTAVPASDAWQRTQLERELARATEAAGVGLGTKLRLADVRALLTSRLGGRPTRANFRTGALTVCTMVPMRSVPHRVVCLVGLDDGVFPRVAGIDGDDVLARRPVTGERDVRSEDRQLLLDAVLAARDHLVITYTGADEHSGAKRPPAVPLGELLDALDRTTSEPITDRVRTRHPLQPYDARNLAGFSFDQAALAGARAATGVRTRRPPFLEEPLPERPPGVVSLADLKRFFGHPAREFLRQRLDVATSWETDAVGDAIPIDLDGLEKWAVGDRLLSDVMAGAAPESVLTAELLRGSMPPGRLGDGSLREIADEAQKLYAGTAHLRTGTPRIVDVDLVLGGGRRLVGTVPGVYGNRVLQLGYSSLRARQRLLSWLDLLALSAGHPDESWWAHAVGKAKAGPQAAEAGPLDHRAADWLRDLVAVYDLGLTAPLPLPVKTGLAWAEAQHRAERGADVTPYQAAEREWRTDPNNEWGIQGEDADAAHVRVWGERASLQRLVDAGLPDLAWRVWGPLLTGAEKVGPL
ncbi:exodeoxyribonuclease V subunit gamma [Nocardioides speluncae]|uniref:exodeoxyribonuclease V subunit gamma n=1 Tax=Nocardioides speluncae TaxID=2670337 RepID=UPI000D69B768|nr:exodeoxyribonuclease V subunit gamma [Nocardioides speluncae]